MIVVIWQNVSSRVVINLVTFQSVRLVVLFCCPIGGKTQLKKRNSSRFWLYFSCRCLREDIEKQKKTSLKEFYILQSVFRVSVLRYCWNGQIIQEACSIGQIDNSWWLKCQDGVYVLMEKLLQLIPRQAFNIVPLAIISNHFLYSVHPLV